jgi:hypothetical protein
METEETVLVMERSTRLAAVSKPAVCQPSSTCVNPLLPKSSDDRVDSSSKRASAVTGRHSSSVEALRVR